MVHLLPRLRDNVLRSGRSEGWLLGRVPLLLGGATLRRKVHHPLLRSACPSSVGVPRRRRRRLPLNLLRHPRSPVRSSLSLGSLYPIG